MRRDVALYSLAKLETNCLEADMTIASWLARVGGIEEDFGGMLVRTFLLRKLTLRRAADNFFLELERPIMTPANSPLVIGPALLVARSDLAIPRLGLTVQVVQQC